jgi:hypothetical protein
MRKPTSAKCGEQRDHDERAHEPPLLADHGEEEVVVGLRQVAELLYAAPETAPEDAAAADGDERLVDLVAHARRIRGRIEERHDPAHAVRCRPTCDHSRGTATQPSRMKWPMRAPAAKTTRADSRTTSSAADMLGCRKMSRLTGAHTTRNGSSPRDRLAEPVLLLHRERGSPDDQDQLRELRRLNGDGSDPQPAAGAVAELRDVPHARQHHDEQDGQQHEQDGPREHAEAPVVQERHAHEEDQPNAAPVTWRTTKW